MESFDLAIISFLNRFAERWPTFDRLVLLVSDNTFLKGGVIVAILWWMWFRNENAPRKRECVLVAIMAGFAGLVVARVLTWAIFRSRPLNDPHLNFRIPVGGTAAGFEGLSSFPSDHAVLFFALVTGLFLASRRVGWLAFIYVSVVICLPRIYLGIHYPTDLLAGAAIGIAIALLFNLPVLRRPMTKRALHWADSQPGLFYAVAFLLTYQIADLFDPVRQIGRFLIRLHKGF